MFSTQFHVRATKQSRRGQALIEYITIVAAIAMTSLVAVSIFGHKVANQYAIGAGMLPGANTADNMPIVTGEFARSAIDPETGALIATGEVSWGSVTGNTTPGEMENNVLASGSNGACAFVCDGWDDDFGDLVPVEPIEEVE